MVIVNKILNIFIFLLAIAACVAAIYLHERRVELRSRADLLAKVVADVAINVDGSGATSSEINSTQGKDGIVPELLNWKTYHKAREKGKNEGDPYHFTKWEDKVKKLPEQVDVLFQLKVKMAENIQGIQEEIRLDLGTITDDDAMTAEDYLQALNSYTSFQDMAAPIPAKIKRVTGRGILLATELRTIYTNLQGNPEKGAYDIFSDTDKENAELIKNLKLISNQASSLYSRSQILAKGYATIIKAFEATEEQNTKLPRFFQPEFNPDNVLSDDLDTINNAVGVLTSDLKKVNIMLWERVVAQEQVVKSRDEITRQTEVIAELNKDNDTLKNKIGTFKAANLRLEKQLAQIKEINGNSNNIMPPGYTAKVLEFNDRFDFIVLNKGKKHGIKNKVEMVVHSNGKYICKVLITKVLEDSCVCDILLNTRPTDDKGNFILPTVGDEAVVPGK